MLLFFRNLPLEDGQTNTSSRRNPTSTNQTVNSANQHQNPQNQGTRQTANNARAQSVSASAGLTNRGNSHSSNRGNPSNRNNPPPRTNYENDLNDLEACFEDGDDFDDIDLNELDVLSSQVPKTALNPTKNNRNAPSSIQHFDQRQSTNVSNNNRQTQNINQAHHLPTGISHKNQTSMPGSSVNDDKMSPFPSRLLAGSKQWGQSKDTKKPPGQCIVKPFVKTETPFIDDIDNFFDEDDDLLKEVNHTVQRNHTVQSNQPVYRLDPAPRRQTTDARGVVNESNNRAEERGVIKEDKKDDELKLKNNGGFILVLKIMSDTVCLQA